LEEEEEKTAQLESASSSEILGEDDVDFPWFKKKLSLLEYCKEKELTESVGNTNAYSISRRGHHMYVCAKDLLAAFWHKFQV